MLTTTIEKIKKLEILSVNTILCNNFSDIKLKNNKNNNTNYICKKCNKNFANSKSLSNHIRSCSNKEIIINTSNIIVDTKNDIIETKDNEPVINIEV